MNLLLRKNGTSLLFFFFFGFFYAYVARPPFLACVCIQYTVQKQATQRVWRVCQLTAY